MLGAVKSATNPDPDKYSYSGFGIEFHSCSVFPFPSLDCGKNVISFRVCNSSFLRINNNKDDILVLGKGPPQGLNDATITAEAEYYVNFSKSEWKLCLSLPYNGINSFQFINTAKMYQFKTEESEVKP